MSDEPNGSVRIPNVLLLKIVGVIVTALAGAWINQLSARQETGDAVMMNRLWEIEGRIAKLEARP